MRLLGGFFKLDGCVVNVKFAGKDRVYLFKEQARFGAGTNPQVGAQGFFTA